MSMNALELRGVQLLNAAGVQVDGDNPWDIQIHNQAFYQRVLNQGALGLGEAYMDHWWDCQRLDQFIEQVISADLEAKVQVTLWMRLKLMLYQIVNYQNQRRAFQVGEKHYDIGNHLFECMLDSRMNYTCGYWKTARDLEQAQLDKLELVAKKLMLRSGMRVLDIGCGFGALAKYLAERYDVSIVGVTISKEQCHYARKNCEGLPVEIVLQDYRHISGQFDRVVSLGMFEHVGQLNYQTYMKVVHQVLKEDGLFLLHTIGSLTSSVSTNRWIEKYIFPNGMLPSIAQIGKSIEGLFVMEDWQNFGADYDKTLMAWDKNFRQHWDELKQQYDDRFYRMWQFYLLGSAGSFRARQLQLWQIIFSRQGLRGGYQSLR
ncbi:MAG: cyclopropane-fatty-acyl-phospholipid synthase [Gammaproteobacteria bacterium RIFCSPHIGHO2_12_FULL_45_12]|nr:MAG: cyclopropane-fatty-acyl-phospholipid synthase [Gammaproteobacteria bacterium RIFCSPHIGHO2_12_FULL_45_12]